MMIFVVGSSRSGTTMMGRILGSHKDIFTFHELHFFEQLWSPSVSGEKISFDEAVALGARLVAIQRNGYLTANDFRPFFKEAKNIVSGFDGSSADVFSRFLRYEASLKNKRISCDQTPRNVFYIDEILRIYPDAKIVFMVRDPRDVLLSQKNKWKRRFLGAKNIPLKEALRSRVNYHPFVISKLWKAAARESLRHSNDDRVLQVRFETLLEQPERVIKEICRFLEIEFTDKMLMVPQVGSSLGLDKPKSHGIDKGRADSWRGGGLNETEIYICEKEAGMLLHELGYAESGLKANPLFLAFYALIFPIQMACALVLNLNRMRKISDSIRRRLR